MVVLWQSKSGINYNCGAGKAEILVKNTLRFDPVTPQQRLVMTGEVG
jgi:hypothetical protein